MHHETKPDSQQLLEQCRVLATRAGICCLPDWTHIELSGNDRVKFLHGLCTNDIKRLAPGQGCEAFLTNVQGKTIGFFFVHCRNSDLLIESVPDQSETIVQALDRYLIREDVQIRDRSRELGALFIGGAHAPDLLASILGTHVPDLMLSSRQVELADRAVFLRRVSITSAPGFILTCQSEDVSDCRDTLLQHGASNCSPEALDVARIEAGTPWFGRDISERNLPQELDRNDSAISFTKGCYLGQETVARIDALGHVNRTLRLLRFDGSDLPEVGATISSDGKVLAEVTSACWSPLQGAPLALAFVRRGSNQPGTQLQTPHGTATVVETAGA